MSSRDSVFGHTAVTFCCTTLCLLITTATATTTAAVESTTTSNSTASSSDTVVISLVDFSASCAFKGWAAVALCRKDFVEKIEAGGRDADAQCCLYRLFEDCARRHSFKLCGEATDAVNGKHLKKYEEMMSVPVSKCEKIDVQSWPCFWIKWENYVSCAIFLLVTLIIDIYIVIWYWKQTNIDRPFKSDKENLV